jgi:acyl dehydratase
MSSIIATRRFSMEDQLGFAAWSGDYNPIHVDAVAARRIAAGAPVVHGIHELLWCLDAITATQPEWSKVARLRVNFNRFVVVGEEVRAVLLQVDAMRLRAEVLVRNGAQAMTAVVEFGDAPDKPVEALPEPAFAAAAAVDIDPTRIPELAGRVPFAQPAEPSPFPRAATLLGARRVSALGAFTRLVGMECPGLHSIFQGLILERGADEHAWSHSTPAIGFRVDKFRPEYRHIIETVWGGGWVGRLNSTLRHAPAAQTSMVELAKRHPADAFAGHVALVVGGSRGIGEVSAKLIAAGGGQIIVTYATGAADAERVAAQIRAAGGRADAVHLDVSVPVAAQVAGLPPVTLLLYYATPMIGGRHSSVFDPERFEQFVRFYVSGFHDVCRALLAGGGKLAALYPSTVFIEERPAGLTEYVMAKAAGEHLCRDLDRATPALRIVIDRLPRLATDQNPGFTDGPEIATTLLPGLLRLVA